MDIVDIIHECWQTAEDHGFHGVGRSFGDTVALIHTEVSEAYEAFRKDGKMSAYTEVDGKPEGVVVELLDAVIRIFDTCIGEAGMSAEDVALWLEHKMAFNKTREHLHGKVI